MADYTVTMIWTIAGNTTVTLMTGTTTSAVIAVTDARALSLTIALWIATVAACITYGLGAIGNVLSLCIFYSQEEFRKISTGLLYLLMTIFNTIHLVALAIEFLRLYDINIYSGMLLQCGFNSFMHNTTRAISTYLAVAVAIDRLIRSEFPVQSRHICTRRNAAILTVIIVIVFSSIWSFNWYEMHFFNVRLARCVNLPVSYEYFEDYIHDALRAVLVCVIPVIIMALANLRLLMNIRSSRRRAHGITKSAPDGPTIQPVPTINGTEPVTNKTRRITSFDRMMFYMMAANVIALFLTQVPFHIDRLRDAYADTLPRFTNRLVRSYLLVWSSLYFGVGFYLYCLSAPLFRRKCMAILRIAFHCRPL